LATPAGVPIHYAASRPRMTRSAGAHADGVILLQGPPGQADQGLHEGTRFAALRAMLQYVDGGSSREEGAVVPAELQVRVENGSNRVKEVPEA
jgi:alkanesulfonate monooxygenase SsuD/methylene tetrahydromethanopterin reductase-like flavin-dependent oxidoreductase (luciferase family)